MHLEGRTRKRSRKRKKRNREREPERERERERGERESPPRNRQAQKQYGEWKQKRAKRTTTHIRQAQYQQASSQRVGKLLSLPSAAKYDISRLTSSCRGDHCEVVTHRCSNHNDTTTGCDCFFNSTPPHPTPPPPHSHC